VEGPSPTPDQGRAHRRYLPVISEALPLR
jgi:hypothetical protein